jgi:hypothetical protein
VLVHFVQVKSGGKDAHIGLGRKATASGDTLLTITYRMAKEGLEQHIAGLKPLLGARRLRCASLWLLTTKLVDFEDISTLNAWHKSPTPAVKTSQHKSVDVEWLRNAGTNLELRVENDVRDLLPSAVARRWDAGTLSAPGAPLAGCRHKNGLLRADHKIGRWDRPSGVTAVTQNR